MRILVLGAGGWLAVGALSTAASPAGEGTVESALRPGDGSTWTVDASPYAGQIVAVTGQVRTSQGSVWIRVDRDESPVPAHMVRIRAAEASAQTGGEWTPISERVPILDDADRLTIAIERPQDHSRPRESDWIRDLEVLPVGPTWYEGPAPLNARSLVHLQAAARLYGAVRFFHPSDQVDAANWDSLALKMVRVAERAPNPTQLAEDLSNLLARVAPTVVIRSKDPSLWDRAVSYAKRGPTVQDALSRSASSAAGVVRWVHRGYAADGPDVAYTSVRERIRGPSGSPPPPSISRIELGGGLLAEVPTTLCFDASGQTLPHVDDLGSRLRMTGTEVAPIPSIPSAHDRTTRLAAVLVAWSTLDHFHPWIEDVGRDWDVVLPEFLETAALDRDREEFVPTLRRMMAILDDGHANAYPFYDETPARLPLRWRWLRTHPAAGDTGASSGGGDERASAWSLVITEVMDLGSSHRPAPEATWATDAMAPARNVARGLRPGDIVLSIDGKESTRLLDSLSTAVSASTQAWRRYRVAEQLATGWRGLTRSLRVHHRDDMEEDVVLRLVDRETIELHEGSVPACRPLPSGFVRFDLNRAAGLDRDWAQLSAARGVVFDLRGYPERLDPSFLERLIDRTITSPTWLMPVTSAPHERRFEPSQWSIDPGGPHLAVPYVFLADERAISKAETYLAIVSAHEIAPIVGSPSAGTFGNMARAVLPGGIRITWTGMLARDQKDRLLRGAGIEPDVRVEPTLEGIASGRDEPLLRALEVLGERRPR